MSQIHFAAESLSHATEGGRAAGVKLSAVFSAIAVFVSVSTASAVTVGPSGDYTTLADALDYAVGLGGAETVEIVVAEGTYTVPKYAVTVPVRIVAESGAAVKLDFAKAVYSSPDKHFSITGSGSSIENVDLYRLGERSLFVSSGAKLIDCTASGAYAATGGTAKGGAIYLSDGAVMQGGTVSGASGAYAYHNPLVTLETGSQLLNVTFADNVLRHYLVTMSGAASMVSNCVFRGTTFAGAGGANPDYRVLNSSGGLVTHCSFIGNGRNDGTYCRNGMVYLDGANAILRNSLLSGNKGGYYSGIYVNNGIVENCTVVGGVRNINQSDKGLDLVLVSGTVRNSIFASLAGVDTVYRSGGTLTCSFSPALENGDGNITGEVRFNDAANGDYSLSFTSPCRNAGDNQSWMIGMTDLAGNDRIRDTTVDMGCYESAEIPADYLACVIEEVAYTPNEDDFTQALEAKIYTGSSEPLTYEWSEGGTILGTSSTLTHDFAYGTHTVTLTVKAGETLTDSKSIVLKHVVFGSTIYVSSSGTAEMPYDTAATAITSIDAIPAALAEAGGKTREIRIVGGTYPVSGITAIAEAVTLKPASDSDAVTLDFNKAQENRLNLSGGAVLEGVTISKPNTYAMALTGGAKLVNCTITGGYAGAFYNPIIGVTAGEVTGCVFKNSTGNHAYDNMYLQLNAGAVVRDTVFDNCTQHDSIVYQTGADSLMSNCVFRNCKSTSVPGANLKYNMVFINAGLMTHCIVTNCGDIVNTHDGGNGSASHGGIVSVAGGIVRNTLLADNYAKTSAGFKVTGGRVENCTVLGGTLNGSSAVTRRNLQQTAGTVVNSVFWNDSGTDGAEVTGGSFTHSSSCNLKDGDGNVSGDPQLDADYVPTSSSNLRDAGDTTLDWITADATDLRGSNRVVNSVIDIGAFEGGELAAELTLVVTYAFDSLDGDLVRYRFTPVAKIGYDEAEDPSYTWTVDGVDAGTGAGDMLISLAPSATEKVVACKVETQGLSADAEVRLAVHNGEFFVSADGSDEYPYSTLATAAKNPATVIALEHPAADTRTYRVHIADGEYALPAANLNSAIELLGEGVVTLKGSGMIYLNHSASVVSNVVFKNVQVMLNYGTVRDSAMTNVRLGENDSIAFQQNNGLLENFAFRDNDSIAWAFYNLMTISAGTARNLVFERNVGFDKLLKTSGSGTVVSNVVFNDNHRSVDNPSQCNLQQYVLYMANGLVANCVITNNGESTSVRDGIAKIAGGTLRNALIADNISTDCSGVNLCGGTLENCTVVVEEGNCGHLTGYGAYGSCLNFTSGSAKNCVFWSKETAQADRYYVRKTGGTLMYSWGNPQGGDPDFSGTRIVTGTDPNLGCREGWDYFPLNPSPLIGGGMLLDWMRDATDIRGEKRIRGNKVDIGAIEGYPEGLILIVR